MAGSKRYFAYESDSGTVFAVLLDESNTEIVNGANANVPEIAARPTFFQPVGMKLRRFIFSNDDGTRQLSCVVLRPSTYATPTANIGAIPDPLPGASGNLSFLRRVPEVQRSIRWGDSGLTDGDLDAPAAP
jgi:hypothetical protein